MDILSFLLAPARSHAGAAARLATFDRSIERARFAVQRNRIRMSLTAETQDLVARIAGHRSRSQRGYLERVQEAARAAQEAARNQPSGS